MGMNFADLLTGRFFFPVNTAVLYYLQLVELKWWNHAIEC